MRATRIEYAGALSHCTARGVNHGAIFFGDTDRHTFLAFLEEVVEICEWVVHAYVLMSNHYHLLVETPKANLGIGMKRLNGDFAKATNKRNGRKGHLFGERYRKIPVEREPHLLELSRYIVLNPVRASLVPTAADWPWSSFRATAGIVAAPSWLEVDWLRQQFHPTDPNEAIRHYRDFVSAREASAYRPWDQLRRGALGGAEFLESIMRRERAIGTVVASVA